MVYRMKNYLFLTDYANMLPGNLTDKILIPAFQSIGIGPNFDDILALSNELKNLKSEDGVKMAIFNTILPKITVERFETLLIRIDGFLDNEKIDIILYRDI